MHKKEKEKDVCVFTFVATCVRVQKFLIEHAYNIVSHIPVNRAIVEDFGWLSILQVGIRSIDAVCRYTCVSQVNV